MRDVLRDRHGTWRGLRWTRQSQAHVRAGRKCAAYGEVVWSWRRDPGVQPSGLCWMGNGDNKGRSPGRVRISRPTIARGKPGCLGCTCLIRVRFLVSLHTVLRAQSAPGFPCALCQREGQRTGKARTNHVARTRRHTPLSSLRKQGPIRRGGCGQGELVNGFAKTTTSCGYGSLLSQGRHW